MEAQIELKDRVGLITGAAGGIGEATARIFAREGAGLVLVDLDSRHMETLRKEIEGLGTAVLILQADVSEEEQVRGVVDRAVDRFNHIDILVNNAGICEMAPIEKISTAAWDRMLAVNLRSVFLFCREILPIMRKRDYGRIISIGSAAGKIGGLAAGAHYASSKAAVMCLTKSLALQTAEQNITVNAISPGPIKTDMTDAWGETVNREFAAKIPKKRYGLPEDVARAILFLASEQAGYITGEILDVNGGLVMD